MSNSQLPTPSASSAGGSSSSDERRRRKLNTSTSSGGSNSPISSTSLEYRAGVPALHLLPLRNYNLHPQNPNLSALETYRQWIEQNLRQRGVRYHSVEFVHRLLPEYQVSNNNIFDFVKAEWDASSEQSWTDAASYIRDYLLEASSNIPASIGVEILAPELYLPRYMTIVEPATHFSKYRKIQSEPK